jgi:cell wall-associated NlpC family hydrolase
VTDGRKRLAAALTTLCIGAVGGSVLTAAPSAADPDIDTVRERVDRLYREAEKASERYNDARIERRDAERRLKRIESELRAERKQVEEVRDRVAASVIASYQGETLTAASQIVLADDPDAFIGQMATVSEYTSRQAGLVEQLVEEVDELEQRQARAERLAEKVEKAEKVLAKEKATIDEKAEDADELLSRLEAEERERQQRVSRSNSRTSTAPAAPTASAAVSGKAGAAVQYALAQVGDAYVYGAAGPSAFDCSGLTMMAWAAAGVSLPHSSGAQMGSGTPVSSSDLQPGDLVFYYSPVSHVGIYVGNGMVVHAANPSTGVRTDPVMSMPFSGAVRPG